MMRRRVFEGGVAVLRHGRRGTVWLSIDRRDVKKFFNVEIEISPRSDGSRGNIYEYINVANTDNTSEYAEIRVKRRIID